MHLEALKSEQKKIFPELKNFPNFYLAGGTALALQIGHRVSVDFDLFSKNDIPLALLGKVRRVFKRARIEIVVNHSEQLSVIIGKTKIDFVRYNFPLMSNLIEFRGIKILSVREIAATKAYTLSRRGTLRDYIDLYFILKDKYATLKEIKKMAEKKYKNEFNFKLFLEQMIYLRDIKQEKIDFLKERIAKKELQNFFEEEVRKASKGLMK